MSCYGPINVKVMKKSLHGGRRIGYDATVPCGHCLGCRTEQGRQWAVRAMHEARMHGTSWFLTLTYRDEELPQNGSLRPKDFQRFIKDLRKEYPPRTVSYYGCGEYGGRTERPHYHALLFGPEFLDRYSHPDSTRVGVWKSQTLEDIWGLGICELGSVTMASASYVAGYVTKKVRQRDNPNHYLRMLDDGTGELVELEKEFARMSLRPAIGRRWLEKYWTDVYPRDFVVFDGREAKPPRYYDKWMDAQHPHLMEDVRQARFEDMIELDKPKLEMKRKIHEARVQLFYGRDGI